MSAEMNARAAETANKIIDALDHRIRRLEKEMSELRRVETADKDWQSFSKVTDLKQGDIVRLRRGAEPFQVVMVYGDHASVIRTHEVTNPCEWEVLR